MNKPIDLLDVLPPSDPIKENRMVDPIVPFLHSDMDSFEAWALRRNYELGRPPLSLKDLQILRNAGESENYEVRKAAQRSPM